MVATYLRQLNGYNCVRTLKADVRLMMAGAVVTGTTISGRLKQSVAG